MVFPRAEPPDYMKSYTLITDCERCVCVCVSERGGDHDFEGDMGRVGGRKGKG